MAQRNTLCPINAFFYYLLCNFCLAVYLMLKKTSSYLRSRSCSSSCCSVSLPVPPHFPYPPTKSAAGENKSLTVEGTVCEEPSVRQDNSGIYHLSYIIGHAENHPKKIRRKVPAAKSISIKNRKIYLPLSKSAIPSPVSGTLRQIHGYHNPGQINREPARPPTGNLRLHFRRVKPI